MGLVSVGLGVALMASSVPAASAASFTVDDSDNLLRPGQDGNACPTLAAEPEPFETWFNTDDIEVRGIIDASNESPWNFAKKISQLVCGAAKNSTIKVGMYFMRAIGTSDRGEQDTQVIWDAMKYVHQHRGVKIGFVLDGGKISSQVARKQVVKAVKSFASVYWCGFGCLNYNSAEAFPYAIDHEKFMTISDTIWGSGYNSKKANPVVYSSSGNFARSQIREYMQEATVFYDDYEMWKLVDQRYGYMKACANKSVPKVWGRTKKCKFSTKKTGLKSVRKIWVDTVYRHYTDSGRGTTISFSPQPANADDYFVRQLTDVDCKVDNQVRIAMFKMTSKVAKDLVAKMNGLVKQGCSVEIILSQSGGSNVMEKWVAKLLNAASFEARCTAVPMHTKLVLVGSKGGHMGRALLGTANMSQSGLTYSEEHVVTVDSRRAVGIYRTSAQRLYGNLLNGWNELDQGSVPCK
ncbi:MAG: phospholipase D-like domain-containing protein [Propionibacteriaceae bacterium]|nr:phospholipase D-like domain-containing protein [Propionibacteriaceae bacterium]